MFERFTDAARRVVVYAQEEARGLRHDSIGTEHLLLGLLADVEDPTAEVLAAHGMAADAVRDEVVAIEGRGRRPPSGHMPFTAQMKRVLESSLSEARALGHEVIDTEHLLLGLTSERHDPAVQLIVRLGCDVDELRQAAIGAISSESRQQESLGQLRAANDLLRAEIARLRRLLARHGIDPDDAA